MSVELIGETEMAIVGVGVGAGVGAGVGVGVGVGVGTGVGVLEGKKPVAVEGVEPPPHPVIRIRPNAAAANIPCLYKSSYLAFEIRLTLCFSLQRRNTPAVIAG